MMIKKLRPLLSFIAIIIISWFAETNTTSKIVFNILTFMAIIGLVLPYMSMRYSLELVEKLTLAYKNGLHLPKIIDIIGYTIIIGILIYNGWTGYALVWALIGFADLRIREVAKINLTLV